jgi:hypothetical protein
MQILNPRSATDPPRRSRTRALRAGPLAGAIVAAVLIAGCGGSSSGGGGVAHVNSSTTAKSAIKTKTKASALAYSQCMRAHGVPNFPDPNSSGEILLTPSVNTDTAAYQSAHNDCKSLEPPPPVDPAASSQRLAAAVKFATCMRAHGVPDFPDPKGTSNGGIGFSATPGGSDTSSPAFQRADQKCGADLSAAGLGGGLTGGS